MGHLHGTLVGKSVESKVYLPGGLLLSLAHVLSIEQAVRVSLKDGLFWADLAWLAELLKTA